MCHSARCGARNGIPQKAPPPPYNRQKSLAYDQSTRAEAVRQTAKHVVLCTNRHEGHSERLLEQLDTIPIQNVQLKPSQINCQNFEASLINQQISNLDLELRAFKKSVGQPRISGLKMNRQAKKLGFSMSTSFENFQGNEKNKVEVELRDRS